MLRLPKGWRGGGALDQKGKVTPWRRMIEALTSRAGIFAILAVVAGLAMRSEAIVAVLLPALKDFNLIRKSLEQNLSNPSESWMGKLVHMLMVSVNGPASIELVTRMDLKPGETAMEVCFGPGIGLEEALLYEGVHLIGVDISPEMHRRAARRAAVAAGIGEGRVELINTPVHNLQGVKDNSVDKVFSINCAYFWHPLDQSLRELHRVMKPGGVMVAGAKYKAIANFDPEVFRNKDMGDLMLALRHAGFDQVASSEVRLASGCPGKHGKSGCHVDERFHFTAIRAVKAVTMSYVPANTV